MSSGDDKPTNQMNEYLCSLDKVMQIKTTMDYFIEQQQELVSKWDERVRTPFCAIWLARRSSKG